MIARNKRRSVNPGKQWILMASSSTAEQASRESGSPKAEVATGGRRGKSI